MWRGSWLLAPLSAALIATAGAASVWLRLDTPNFTVVGSVDERELRSVAAEFERFREALGQLLGPSATATVVPAVVIVFASNRAFEPFRPVYRGKPIEVAGLFVGTSDINYIAVVKGDRDVRPILHEYAHLMTANVAPNLPLWLREGLAEYYSTFELRRDGREAVVGRPIEPHVLMLQRAKLLKLTELVNVQHDSPLYNEGNRRTVLYAQSWALVHYLLRGEPSRADLVTQYIKAVENGTSANDAWTLTFGPAPIEAGLKRYIQVQRFNSAAVSLAERVGTVAAVARPLGEGEAEAFLGDFLTAQQREAEAAARLEPAAHGPDGARARIALARVRAAQKRLTDARALLEGSEALAGDWLADYAIGIAAAYAFAQQRPGTEAAAATAFARDAMRRVLAARPDLAHAWYLLASFALLDEAEVETAVSASRRALALAPNRLEYAVRHAEALVRHRDYETARHILGPLLANPRAAPVGDHVRSLLAYISTLERAAAEAPDVEAPQDKTGRVSLLDFRKPQPGEARAAGMLTDVDCRPDGLTLHVRINGQMSQFRTGRFQDVQFVTYRDELRGNIACGPREPEELVYITWRAAGPGRIPVAVEFLPKGYRLKPTPRSRR
ncbi:MAG: DUF1570 domain-containing protein [Vicinamibacterales bacterium]